jgi:hypothetical protein
MRYTFFILILILLGCATTKNTPKDSNPEIFKENDTLKLVMSDSLLTDTVTEPKTELVSEAMIRPYKPQKEVIIKEVIKNSTTETKVNSETDLGQVIYKVPDTMKVMKNYDVIVRISKSQTNIEISNNLSGKIIQKSIKTTNRMSVELVDPTGESFQIKEVNSEKQLVDSSYTEWKFNVMPLKSGQNKIDLVISIFKNDDVKQIVYSDEIWVQSNAPAQIKSFWYDNWKWSIEKLIIPVITWLFGMWWGKRREKKKRRY